LRSAVDDHQTQNALTFARRASMVLVSEADSEMTRLGGEINVLLTDAEKWIAAVRSLRHNAATSGRC
jgi:UDP-N-acetylglucosamine transferase subunit ALG13